MRLPLYRIDAFANGLFAGNPAAVCWLEAGLPDVVMQAIAADIICIVRSLRRRVSGAATACSTTPIR